MIRVRRIWRIARNGLVAVSALLWLVASVLWVRSFWVEDNLEFYIQHVEKFDVVVGWRVFRSVRGKILLNEVTERRPFETSESASTELAGYERLPFCEYKANDGILLTEPDAWPGTHSAFAGNGMMIKTIRWYLTVLRFQLRWSCWCARLHH